MRGATGVTIQPHQILRLSRRKTHILSPHHIWNVIYSARSNRCHHPTSPNTAPATKNDSTALSSSHMKRHFQCAEQQVSLSNLTKYCACHEKWHCKISKKISKNRWNVISNAGPIRAWSDHDPTMKTQTATRLASEVTFRAHHEHFLLKNTTFRAQSYIQTFTKYCACHVKCHLNFTKYCACHAERLTYLVLIAYETSFTVRGATGVTIQPHQILRLPRKMTRLLYRPHIWNVISNARSNRCHHPTSPNTAPATKNDSTALSSSHMKRHFQCAEQQVSLSNLTKYCACHEKWHCKISKKISKNRWNVISNAGPIRAWSEHDPSMIRAWSDENANRNPPRKWGYFSSSPRAFSIEKYNVSRPILHSNLHQILRLPRKVPLELHQILRLSRRKTHILSPHRIWNVIYSARSNRCHHPTSPNTAPATKNDSTALSSSHMKRHFQCAEQQVSLSNLTKYCACHEKWLDCFIVLTYETSFQCAEQQVSLSNLTKYCACHEKWHCKISKKISKNRWNVISNAGPIRAWSEHDPTMKTQTATRLASEVTFRAHHEHFLLKNTTFRAQSYIQTFTKYCACHVKCHLNFTKYCACHEKWHLNFTKYCACHEKWHLNFTKYCAGHCTVTELYCTLLYLTLLYVTLLYVTLLYVTLLYLTLLYLTLLYLTLLDTTLRDTTLRDTTLLDSTLLDSTLLDSTWHYSTWHYSTWLLFYLTLLYLTCSTWLNFTEMLFVYRKFLNLNFLWWLKHNDHLDKWHSLKLQIERDQWWSMPIFQYNSSSMV